MDENTMDTRINNGMDWERATNATMEDEFFNYSASSSTNGTSLTPPNNTLLDLPPPLNATASPQGMDSKNNDIWANLMAVGWIFVILYCCCCKRRVPSREHWRGDEIRRRYQEMLARERAKEEKEQQTPEYRHKLVQHNMRTKRVIAKDAEGSLTLGRVDCETGGASEASPPQQPVQQEGDNQEEHACVICLDSFQVGDVVSWPRFSDECQHVYHTECIEQWLEGKRQDECPSCRHRIIVEDPPLDLEEEKGSLKIDTDACPSHVHQDPSQKEEESFFVIVHGLISRAARRASYSLVGNKGSFDESADQQIPSGLPPASPFRRVVSHEPTRSPPIMVVGGILRRAPGAAVPVNLSLHNLMGHHNDNDRYCQIVATGSSDLEEDEDYYDVEAADSGPLSFRRVKSDLSGTPARHLRRYPMLRTNSTGGTSCSSGSSDSSEGPPAVHRQSALANEETVPDQMIDVSDTSGGAGDDEEDDLEWLVPNGAAPMAPTEEEDHMATTPTTCEQKADSSTEV